MTMRPVQPVQQEERESRWHWRDLQLEDLSVYPTEEPEEPKFGDRWYDAEAHCLCVWDGIEWVEVPLD
jgi:hypothetical protein